MRQTKKLTLSAAIVALGTLFMSLGAIFEVFDLSAVALAAVLVAFVYIELGSPYTWLVWLCTTLTTFLFYPSNRVMWFYYPFLQTVVIFKVIIFSVCCSTVGKFR